jgi:hypothetical protein
MNRMNSVLFIGQQTAARAVGTVPIQDKQTPAYNYIGIINLTPFLPQSVISLPHSTPLLVPPFLAAGITYNTGARFHSG